MTEPEEMGNTTPHEEGLEVHPLVELLVARMRTYPKEFYQRVAPTPTNPAPVGSNTNKIGKEGFAAVAASSKLWNRKEKRLFNEALREVRMAEAYERFLMTLMV